MDKKIRSSKSKPQLAFYEPPACVEKTSSEIISEARAAIMSGGIAGVASATMPIIQPVNTKRPYTPREHQRTLFGPSRGTGQRPPSSFSLRYLQHQDSGDSGDANASGIIHSKRSAHLQPMPLGRSGGLDILRERNRTSISDLGSAHDFEVVVDAPNATNPWARLPSISRMIDAQEMRRKRRYFKASASLDNLPEELEGTDGSSKTHANDAPVRNAYSSPKEHFERLSDGLSVANLQREGPSATLATSTSSAKTPRKLMKHDDPAPSVLGAQQLKVETTSQGGEETKILKRKTSSSTSQDEQGQAKSKDKAKTTDQGQSANKVDIISLEQNLFGPNVKLSASKPSHSYTEVDGGVFGEKLHDKNDAPLGRLELDKEAAIYDNCINEAKLANTYINKTSEENLKPSSKTQQIIIKLTELAENEGPDAVVIKTLDELYNALISYRKGDVSTKLKTQVLKCVYRFVERSEDALLLKLAQIIFCLPVRGSNLAGVFKLVFKVARSDKNDSLFLRGNILDLFIDALGSASPLEDAEACVYGYGALKFLTMNNQLLNYILDLGTLDLMVLHLKIVNSTRSEGGRLPEQTSHAIFQLTGALRNIAGEETTFPMLVSNGAVVQLCQSMELFSADLDLVTNIARTFSIISTNDECCEAIVKYKNCTKLFAKLFSKYPGRQDIVVRLGYALGNLLATSDKTRLELWEEEGAMDTLLNLLELYLQKDLQLANQDSQKSHQKENFLSIESGSDGSVEDVIVKIIRILANMSMNMEVGERITCLPDSSLDEAEDEHVISSRKNHNTKDRNIGDKAVGFLLTVLRRKSVAESTELVLSTLSTLNNLTFYPSGTEHSIFKYHMMDLSQALYTLLMSSSDECLVETTKVLGNLSRSKSARDFLLETGGLHQLLNFLKTDNHELLRTTTGVLVNLMADADKREALHNSEGLPRLIAMLLHHGESDWQLASLICQVLWNFCIDMTNLTWLGTNATQLVDILVDLMDEEHLFGTRDSDSNCTSPNENSNLTYQQWEEFAMIATNLLEKIETYMESVQESNLNPTLPINQLNLDAGTTADRRYNHWEDSPSSGNPTPATTY